MILKRLPKKGQERLRSSLQRLLGNLFQKDGPTTTKLLWCIVEVRVTDRKARQSKVIYHPAWTTPANKASEDKLGLAWSARQLQNHKNCELNQCTSPYKTRYKPELWGTTYLTSCSS